MASSYATDGRQMQQQQVPQLPMKHQHHDQISILAQAKPAIISPPNTNGYHCSRQSATGILSEKIQAALKLSSMAPITNTQPQDVSKSRKVVSFENHSASDQKMRHIEDDNVIQRQNATNQMRQAAVMNATIGQQKRLSATERLAMTAKVTAATANGLQQHQLASEKSNDGSMMNCKPFNDCTRQKQQMQMQMQMQMQQPPPPSQYSSSHAPNTTAVMTNSSKSSSRKQPPPISLKPTPASLPTLKTLLAVQRQLQRHTKQNLNPEVAQSKPLANETLVQANKTMMVKSQSQTIMNQQQQQYQQQVSFSKQTAPLAQRCEQLSQQATLMNETYEKELPPLPASVSPSTCTDESQLNSLESHQSSQETSLVSIPPPPPPLSSYLQQYNPTSVNNFDQQRALDANCNGSTGSDCHQSSSSCSSTPSTPTTASSEMSSVRHFPIVPFKQQHQQQQQQTSFQQNHHQQQLAERLLASNSDHPSCDSQNNERTDDATSFKQPQSESDITRTSSSRQQAVYKPPVTIINTSSLQPSTEPPPRPQHLSKAPMMKERHLLSQQQLHPQQPQSEQFKENYDIIRGQQQRELGEPNRQEATSTSLREVAVAQQQVCRFETTNQPPAINYHQHLFRPTGSQSTSSLPSISLPSSSQQPSASSQAMFMPPPPPLLSTTTVTTTNLLAPNGTSNMAAQQQAAALSLGGFDEPDCASFRFPTPPPPSLLLDDGNDDHDDAANDFKRLAGNHHYDAEYEHVETNNNINQDEDDDELKKKKLQFEYDDQDDDEFHCRIPTPPMHKSMSTVTFQDLKQHQQRRPLGLGNLFSSSSFSALANGSIQPPPLFRQQQVATNLANQCQAHPQVPKPQAAPSITTAPAPPTNQISPPSNSTIPTNTQHHQQHPQSLMVHINDDDGHNTNTVGLLSTAIATNHQSDGANHNLHRRPDNNKQQQIMLTMATSSSSPSSLSDGDGHSSNSSSSTSGIHSSIESPCSTNSKLDDFNYSCVKKQQQQQRQNIMPPPPSLTSTIRATNLMRSHQYSSADLKQLMFSSASRPRTASGSCLVSSLDQQQQQQQMQMQLQMQLMASSRSSSQQQQQQQQARPTPPPSASPHLTNNTGPNNIPTTTQGGLVTKPRPALKQKKTVSFSDKVELVACAEEQCVEHLPNPLLARVLARKLQ